MNFSIHNVILRQKSLYIEIVLKLFQDFSIIEHFITGTMAANLHKVFVYGTLKKGEPNHNWFSKQKDGFHRFICDAQTTEKFPLIIATKYNVPFLLFGPGKSKLPHNININYKRYILL